MYIHDVKAQPTNNIRPEHVYTLIIPILLVW